MSVIDKLYEKYDVEHKLVVVVNGQEHTLYTSSISFDDLVGDSDNADTKVLQLVSQEAADEQEGLDAMAEDNMIDLVRGVA